MELLERIDRLEAAHRSLAAEHTALWSVMQTMASVIMTAPEAEVRRALLIAYDIASSAMTERGYDSEYQAQVRAAIDRFSGPILVGYTSRRQQSSP